LQQIITATVGDYATVGEMVYAVLREAIVSGVLRHGEKLRQESLAEMIGVSRIPVRSALMQLEADGLVEFTPRRGARVRSLTPELVDEVFSSRVLLETHALRLSMAAMTPARAGRLAELATRLDNPEPDAEFRSDMIDFYRELYDADHQVVLADLIDRLRDRVGRQFVGRRIHEHPHSHRALISSVIAGDPEAAVQRLIAHLGDVKVGTLAQMG
jgi:DNA-binding GntR family transcriptional regulator